MSDADLHVTVFADDARLESLAAYSDHIDELAAVFAIEPTSCVEVVA